MLRICVGIITGTRGYFGGVVVAMGYSTCETQATTGQSDTQNAKVQLKSRLTVLSSARVKHPPVSRELRGRLANHHPEQAMPSMGVSERNTC